MENTDLLQLIEKYRGNKCSPEEVKLLIEYFSRDSIEHNQLMDMVLQIYHEQPSAEQMADKNIQSSVDQAFQNIQLEIARSTKIKDPWKLWIKILATAAILILVGFCYFYIFNNKNINKSPIPINAQNVLPGGNKATLKLPDGRTINLSGAQSGIILKNNSLTYKDGSTIPEKTKGLITISTPLGGEYQIVLSDGTKVWLNAATTLQYSTRGEREQRIVKLVSGEAYFQVTKDKTHPFIVETPTQQIQVLGTHFNVNSYADEGKTVTTLEEGSVKVLLPDGSRKRNNILLKPGEQSINQDGRISVEAADLQTALAWKDNKIYFKQADIRTIMRQVSRWYNLNIEYQGAISDRKFTGGVYRSANLDELLKILTVSEIHFEVKNNTLIVKP